MSNAKWIRPKHHQPLELTAKQVAQLCRTANIRQPSTEMLSNDLVRLAYAMRASAMIKRRLEERSVAFALDELQNPVTVAAVRRYAGLNPQKSETVAVDLKKRAAGDVDA